MNKFYPVGTFVEFSRTFAPAGSPRKIGTVIGYGVDQVTGDEPRTVYLIRLDEGNYLFRGMYVSAVIAHPDSVFKLGEE